MAVVVVASFGGYLAVLGWDQHKTVGADGYLHGPYEPWQVVVLCAVVGLATAWAGWTEGTIAGPIAATVTVTVAFAIGAANDSENDGLWPIGAAGLAIATLIGTLICARFGAWLRQRSDRPAPK